MVVDVFRQRLDERQVRAQSGALQRCGRRLTPPMPAERRPRRNYPLTDNWTRWPTFIVKSVARRYTTQG
jgi:hypothetical protein